MNIILIGPPGCGKGTQAQLLSKHFGLKHISTGQLIREKIRQHDTEALKIKEYVDQGQFVPDKYVIKLLKENISEQGNIFDGVPRDINQAHALDELTPIDLVIELTLTEQEILERLVKRKRNDDDEKIVKKRVALYEDLTEPLLEYYRPRSIVHTVDASQCVEDVFSNIHKLIESFGG